VKGVGMAHARRKLLAIALSAFLLYGFIGSAADMNYAEPAAALFNEFETVFFAKADVLISSGAYDHAPKSDIEILRFPFMELLEALKALGGNTSQEVVSNSEAILVGAKDFRPPAGLGGVHSQRCYIVILRTPSKFNLRQHFHQAPSASVGGSPVWEWSAKLGEFGEEDPRASSFFAAQVSAMDALGKNSKFATILQRSGFSERLSA